MWKQNGSFVQSTSLISDSNNRQCLSPIPHINLDSTSRAGNVHVPEYTETRLLLLLRLHFFMELVKDCGWGKKCCISAVCTVVRDGRGIVVSVVWFSRGLVCGGGRKFLVTQHTSVAFSKQWINKSLFFTLLLHWVECQYFFKDLVSRTSYRTQTILLIRGQWLFLLFIHFNTTTCSLLKYSDSQALTYQKLRKSSTYILPLSIGKTPKVEDINLKYIRSTVRKFLRLQYTLYSRRDVTYWNISFKYNKNGVQFSTKIFIRTFIYLDFWELQWLPRLRLINDTIYSERSLQKFRRNLLSLSSLSCPEDGGGRFLRKFVTYLPQRHTQEIYVLENQRAQGPYVSHNGHHFQHFLRCRFLPWITCLFGHTVFTRCNLN